MQERLKDAIHWLDQEYQRTLGFIETEPVGSEHRKILEAKASVQQDVLNRFLNVWDGSRESVIGEILRHYDTAISYEENGRPRKLNAEELVEHMETLRDEPYSQITA